MYFWTIIRKNGNENTKKRKKTINTTFETLFSSFFFVHFLFFPEISYLFSCLEKCHQFWYPLGNCMTILFNDDIYMTISSTAGNTIRTIEFRRTTVVMEKKSFG